MRAQAALSDIPFDSCFSSPHTRAQQTTEIVWPQWQGTAEVQDPIYLPSLAEVDLGWFQGLRNGKQQQGLQGGGRSKFSQLGMHMRYMPAAV